MSILQYFCCKDGFPDPRDPMSNSRAIEQANAEIEKVLRGSAKMDGNSNKHGKKN